MSECKHEKGLGYEGECVLCLKSRIAELEGTIGLERIATHKLEAELEDTVTECLAAKSNEDIMRKQLSTLREQIQVLEMEVKGRNPDGTIIQAKPFHQKEEGNE